MLLSDKGQTASSLSLIMKLKTIKGDLFEHLGAAPVVITTNGTVKKNGKANMGQGNAKQLSMKCPWASEKLGKMLQEKGNHVHYLGEMIISFPVEHTWLDLADLRLVEQSAIELKALADEMNWTVIYMPLPGCGGGGLSSKSVLPILEKYLDERFIIVDRK